MSEDALSRTTRINDLLAEWREKLADESTNTPLRVIELLAANPFLTATGVAHQLGVAFSTAQRAIQRLEQSDIVQPTTEAQRGRVYCARTILEILEEPAHLMPATQE
jgi:Fic family protein